MSYVDYSGFDPADIDWDAEREAEQYERLDNAMFGPEDPHAASASRTSGPCSHERFRRGEPTSVLPEIAVIPRGHIECRDCGRHWPSQDAFIAAGGSIW